MNETLKSVGIQLVLAAAIVVSGCATQLASAPTPTLAQSLAQPLAVTATQISKAAHTSDGSDRAKGTLRRFPGQLGGRGVTYKGYQYVIYFTGKDRTKPKAEQFGEVYVARRAITSNDWQHAKVEGHRITSDDAHNRPSIAISEGDGRIHITFDHHNERGMNYANTSVGVADAPSTTPWNNQTFTFRRNFGWSDFKWEVTYPSFAKSGNGDLILYFRDGGSYGGEMQKVGYSSATQSWETSIKRISSENGSWNGQNLTRGPYLSSGIQVGQDGSLQMTWLFREKVCQDTIPDELYCNHGLYYAKSLDGGTIWRRYDGSVIADLSKGEAISIDNIGPLAVDLPQNLAPSNPSNAAAIDPKTGEFHVLISHLAKPNDNASRASFHYVGAANGARPWTGKQSGFAGGGAQLQFSGDQLFAFGGGRQDPRIYVANRSDRFGTWQEIALPKAASLPNQHPSGGFSTWDTSRLNEGLVSLIWQEPNPATDFGAPTPMWVIDYRLATGR